MKPDCRARLLKMVSKTRMDALVRSFEWKAVRAGLAETPELMTHRDEHGRNWLHVCCSSRPVDTKAARGERAHCRCPARSRHRRRRTGVPRKRLEGHSALVRRRSAAATSCSRSICSNSAAIPTVRALGHVFQRRRRRDSVARAQRCDRRRSHRERIAVHRGREGAVTSVRPSCCSSSVPTSNAEAGNGMTPRCTHMLRKNSDKAHVRMLVDHGTRGDIPDPHGVARRTRWDASEIPEFKRMAEELRRR